jgi:hypothetical protein
VEVFDDLPGRVAPAYRQSGSLKASLPFRISAACSRQRSSVLIARVTEKLVRDPVS